MSGDRDNLLLGMLKALCPDTAESPIVVYADNCFDSLTKLLAREWSRRKVQYQGFADQVASSLEEGPVLAIPPWGRLENRSAAPVALAGLRTGSGAHQLILLTPATLLGNRSWRAVRRELAENWQIQLVACLSGGVPGIRPDSRVALLQLTPPSDKHEVLRMFEVPGGLAEPATIIKDFQRLLRMGGGSSDFGFVLRERPAAGESLAPHLHDPAVVSRRGSLSDYGETTTLGDLFEIRQGTLRPEDIRREGDTRGPLAHRVLSGRDIRHDHSIAAPDEDSRWTYNTDSATQAGDIAIRALYNLNGPTEGFVWARIEAGDTSAVPDQNVIVLRPKIGVSTQHLDFVLRYLSSRHVMELSEDPRVSSFRRLHESTLSNWRVPLPDEPLSDAINDVESVRHRVAQWADEADDIIESLFDDNSATLSRQRVIERSRNVRLRMTAIGNIETLSGRVRTQYPLPIAYSWRMLEVARSNGPTREAYQALLDVAEHTFAFTAGVGLALAREVGKPVGAAKIIATARLARGQGPSMSDWCSILDELAGQSFSGIDAAISTTRKSRKGWRHSSEWAIEAMSTLFRMSHGR